MRTEIDVVAYVISKNNIDALIKELGLNLNEDMVANLLRMSVDLVAGSETFETAIKTMVSSAKGATEYASEQVPEYAYKSSNMEKLIFFITGYFIAQRVSQMDERLNEEVDKAKTQAKTGEAEKEFRH